MSRSSLALTLRAIPPVAYILGGTLVALTALSWLVVSQSMMPMPGMLDFSTLLWFTAIWAVGMVAMMFPSLLPMAYMVAVSSVKTIEGASASRGLKILRPALFILGYVGVWTLVGLAFYLAITGLFNLDQSLSIGSLGLLGGGVLIATGIYQFTRFKQRALMKCRSPMGFMMTGWRDGIIGSALMGSDYGLFCTKCCWVLMAGLLFVGAMSLPLMGLFTIIIFAEKIGPFGSMVSKIVGVAFVATGVFVAVPLGLSF